MIGRKIGIMGGTFDPIHYGHLMLAEQIRTSFHLDEIIFIPVGKPPHKAHFNSANQVDRYEMAVLATGNNSFFKVSDIETKRTETTYTIDTIRLLKKTLPDCDELYFITGADAILLLDSWKNYEELVKMVRFVAATRPGIDLERLNDKVSELTIKYGAVIDVCYIPALAISSTDIRRRVNEEKSIRYLLPESVEAYIESKGLYKEHHDQYFEVLSVLKKNMSLKRLTHTLGTAQMARRLAVHYNVDPVKAEFAGLCHDFAKEIDRESMLAHINHYGIYFDPVFKVNPNIAHGEVGAELIKDQFNIHDEMILDAIRWHTYGFKKMSTLSKIVYVADLIEEGRRFECVEILRNLAFKSLDQTVLAYNNMNQKYLENGIGIHRNTLEMIEEIINEEKS